MKSKLMSKTMALASLSMIGLALINGAGSAQASDWDYQQPGYDHGRDRGRGHDRDWGDDVVTRRVGQRYTGRSRILLNQLVDLDYRYRGRTIESISIRASSDYGRADAQLIIDGRYVGYSQNIPSYMSDVYFSLPSYDNQVGHEIDSLAVVLNGQIYVDSVTIQFSDSSSYPEPYPTYPQPYPTYPQPQPPTYPEPYPTYPQPYPGNGRGYSCVVHTNAGTFYGTGPTAANAEAAARNVCLQQVGNSYRCNSGDATCNPQ